MDDASNEGRSRQVSVILCLVSASRFLSSGMLMHQRSSLLSLQAQASVNRQHGISLAESVDAWNRNLR